MPANGASQLAAWKAWTHHCTPESVQALLDAGASVRGIKFPSGYTEVEELLRQRGAVNSLTK